MKHPGALTLKEYPVESYLPIAIPTRAMAIAQRLDEIEAPVVYPGLPSHSQHELLKSMVNPSYGFGGVLTIDCGTR